MSSPQEIAALASQAGQAASQGRWADAEALWRRVRGLDPRHPHALYSLAMHAYQRADLRDALELIGEARASAPRDPLLALTHAVFLRDSGDTAGEWTVIHEALAIDAYYLPGLLAKAAWLERAGQPKAAAATYRNALRIAPPESHWPAQLRDQLGHARRVADAYGEAFAAHLAAAIATRPGAAESRWREAVSIMSGRTRPYNVDCNQLHVPRLPAIPFFDRAQFPWAEALEARTDAIREELAGALAAEEAEFSPYIQYRPGEPVNQWGALNHSRRWKTYALWQGGHAVDTHLARCPQTAAALAQVEMADIDGLCPNAMFSALAPHTEIPPHHGETNARLVVHLPLIVPDRCLYRVGFEERRWEVGRLLFFDDSIEHTARNDSDELRVVLIFDVWNPLLSAGERDLVREMTRAARAFNAD